MNRSRRGNSNRRGQPGVVSRRSLLKSAAAIAALSALGCEKKAPTDINQAPVRFKPGAPVPWVNWGGNLSCYPENRVSARTEDQIAETLKGARGCVRAVGSSHSFSALVPTDDTLVATDLLYGIIGHDPEKLQADVWGGTRLHQLGMLLDGIEQAMENLPDMDYPSIAGSIATSVHGTGIQFGSLSTQVAGLTLATPSGELVQCSPHQNPEIFKAARVNIGALGIVTRIKLQNVAPFNLTEVTRVEKTREILEDIDNRFANNRLFEFMPFPHADLSLSITTNDAQPGDENAGEDDPNALEQLRDLFESTHWVPAFGSRLYEKIVTGIMADTASSTRTGPSYKVLPHVRIIRFREMEYSVPEAVGAECVKEILAAYKSKNLDTCFPLEVRKVEGDDIWLSMFEGGNRWAISIHQFFDKDYKSLFAEIEPIFWKYGGRPHWGKLHTLGREQLSKLYPHWRDFQEVRRSLDPQGKMLNTHLKSLFGA